MRPGKMARINLMLQVQIRIRLHASSRAHSCDPAREIKAWRGKSHLRDEHRLLVLSLAIQVRTDNIEEMIVHADNARHHAVSTEIANRSAVGRRHVSGWR